MTTNNAQHALVWLLTVHSAARTGSRTHHRNPGLDIRAIFEEGRENAKLVDCQSSPCVGLSTTLGKGMKPTPGEVFAGARWGWVMNELTPRGHLRPLGGRENPRRARPESRSPRRCAYAWRRCLLFAGRPEGIDQGTHDRHARASPHPQLHMRKGVNRNPSRRPGLAVSDDSKFACSQNWVFITQLHIHTMRGNARKST